MAKDSVDAKAQDIAQIIDGRVVDDKDRVAVCVKGSVKGLPATLEAMYPNWPFGVMYTVESRVVEDPAKVGQPSARITIYPRMGRGFMSILTRVVLFESKGMSVNDKKLESRYIMAWDDSAEAQRYLKYPGVSEFLQQLDGEAKFSELVIKTDAGIFLSQPNNFNSLDLDVCRGTFRILGELAHILHEAF
jgi:hypothetical protein